MEVRVAALERTCGDIKGILGRLEPILVQIDQRTRQQGETLNRHSEILNRQSESLSQHSEILNQHSNILNRHSDILNRHSDILARHDDDLKDLKAQGALLAGYSRKQGEDIAEIKGRISQLPNSVQLFGFMLAVLTIAGIFKYLSL